MPMINIMSSNGSGQGSLFPGFSSPVWSPDGKILATSLAGFGGASDITLHAVMPPNGMVALTGGMADDRPSSWK